MKLNLIKEPKLVFADGQHICPRMGIARYGVYDARYENSRRDRILLGAVGDREGLEKLMEWCHRIRRPISAKPNNRQPNLFQPFPGFDKASGYKADLVLDERNMRDIKNSQIDELLAIKDWDDRVHAAVSLYHDSVKYLAENRQVEVVVCVIPDRLYEVISIREPRPLEETEEAPSVEELSREPIESDFRRALKAKSMYLSKPLQLVREATLEPGADKDQQDEATKAWNLCTALYYKGNKTVPWRLQDNPNRSTVCYVGIGFYRSRDRQILNTSLAQVFDELGQSVILRGTPVVQDKEDRRPYMTYDQAFALLRRALEEYRIALGTMPSRLVVHKSSNFRDEELAGFEEARKDLRVGSCDYVTLHNPEIRLLRRGLYPPHRGSWIELDRKSHLLYTRGAVEHYQTYPGSYVPQPLEIRIARADASPQVLCEEILSLTKMNWNNTQFDGKHPITIDCARKVGEIMKYLDENDRPNISYSYYM